MECGPSEGCSGSAATDVKLIPALDFQASTLLLLLAYLSREVLMGVKFAFRRWKTPTLALPTVRLAT